MDLGLARRSYLDETLPRGGSPITVAGTVIGTPDYVPPEQSEGALVTPATDIYAFGVVLYEMVTGRFPFEASTPIAAAARRANVRRPFLPFRRACRTAGIG
jgi:serine/threonine-protein kinase